MLLVVPFAALHVALAFASAYWLVLALIPALLFTRRLLPAARNGWVDLAREACLALSAYLVYFLVRGMVKDQAAIAYTHAEHVIAFERRLGIFWELGLHRRVVNSAALVSVANWIYVWFYWPVLVAALVWLFRWHRATYPLYRNALLVSGSLGLVLFATFPVAPPRFVTGLDFSDTVALRSFAYHVLLPQGLANQYAAMPSLHAGWILLVGIAIARHTSSRFWRCFGFAMPVLMFLAIVATANHYIIDGIVGDSVALVGLGCAYLAPRAFRRARLFQAPPSGPQQGLSSLSG